MRYWDSSALVPLVIEQAATAEAERWLRQDAEVATWTLSQVEISSALWRLVREGALDERSAGDAETLAVDLLRRAHLVIDVERAKAGAVRLLRLHQLRAADALQLSAAIAWADGETSGRTLHTLDRRLATAA